MMRQNLGSCTIQVGIMACVLQAASAVKFVDATLWRVIKRNSEGVLKPA